jgi:hypothetical protein
LDRLQERKSVTRSVQNPEGSRLRIVVSRVPDPVEGLIFRFRDTRPVEGRGIPGPRSGTRGTRI